MKRHMIFHICPLIRGGESWRKHVSNIRTHAHLFDGKIVIGIVHGEGLESPETVQEAMQGIPVTDWIIEENTSVHESTTFVKMLEVIQFEPGITFRGHCKGVSLPPGKVEHEWADIMWKTCMDIRAVDKAMETHVFAGPFKIQEGASCEPDAYRWFFAGTFFWFKNETVFERNWRADNREWDRWYAEWWPGDLAMNKEAHCLFMDNMRRRDFRRGRWNNIIMPEFRKQGHRMKLSQAFTECGSDKNTSHSYGPFYDTITELNTIKSVLEIGVYKGWSLSAWRTHDSTIKLLGVDAIRRCKFPIIMAITPDYAPVIKYCREHGLTFDVIVDDGSHAEDSQILGLYYLREFLSPSGVYVIEDLQTQEAIDRMRRIDGATIFDYRNEKNQYDDVLAVWKNQDGKI